jgi:predicted nuclease of predicted toxin-antitoxin system
MRFLVDECTGSMVAEWLRTQGHDVFSVYDSARGMSDEFVVDKAFVENRILVTNDKDFGEKVYREQKPHHGIILMRLADERASMKISVLKKLIKSHASRLTDQFVVVTEKGVRFAKNT